MINCSPGQTTDSLVPIKQQISSLEFHVNFLVETCERLYNNVDKMLERLEEVCLDGRISLGDFSRLCAQEHHCNQEQLFRDEGF